MYGISNPIFHIKQKSLLSLLINLKSSLNISISSSNNMNLYSKSPYTELNLSLHSCLNDSILSMNSPICLLSGLSSMNSYTVDPVGSTIDTALIGQISGVGNPGTSIESTSISRYILVNSTLISGLA